MVMRESAEGNPQSLGNRTISVTIYCDIELTTALGVHGPKELFVWIAEGGNE